MGLSENNSSSGKKWSKLAKASFTFSCLLGVLVGLYYFHKSPTTQLMGELISHKETTEKVVALTFDDGPSNLRLTSEVLDILDSFDIKATFFLVGEAMKSKPESVNEIVRRGHELANHSYSHKMMLFKSQNWLTEEIAKTDQLIVETGHTGEIYFRPPFGKKLLALPWYLSKHNRKTVTWDIDIRPEAANMNLEKIHQQIEAELKPGSIILMHVLLSSRQKSRAALPEIIQGIKNKGYTFLKLSELLEKED